MIARIRPSVPADLRLISQLHRDAFGPCEGPEIAKLVRDLFTDSSALPLFSFVATDSEKILGHILFTRVEITGAEDAVSAQILAPLAVLPSCQATGIGSRLMAHGLDVLMNSGADLVFVLGHPEYYPRAGFRPALPLGLTAPFPIAEKNADAWMVRAFRRDILESVQGRVRCSNSLNQPQHWTE